MTTHTPVTESELADKATAPRLTPDTLQAQIASEHYFTADDGCYGTIMRMTSSHDKLYNPVIHTNKNPLPLLTLCVLVLNNGFTVVGKSACASPENFNADIGRRLAREDAIRQMWPLLGYELRTKLANQDK